MTPKIDTRPPGLLAGQALHATGLAIVLAGTIMLWRHFDAPAPVAFWCAVAIPIVHQIFVWLCWRLQLRTGVIARTIGFNGYLATFAVLFLARFVSLGILGKLDRGTLGLASSIRMPLLAVCVLLGGYAVYSSLRYFGHKRAVGGDHFFEHYRTMPMVKEGIFRFTDNGMYAFVFLLFWALGLYFDSLATVLVAGYSHAYIWIHYFSLERPDMDFIYGPRTQPDTAPPR